MSEFSKGKWYVDSSGVLRSDDEYDRSIAVLYRANATKNIDNANERLIVAAPEMYGLLQEMCKIQARKEQASTENNKPSFMGALIAQNVVCNKALELLRRIDGTEANDAQEQR